MTTATCGSIVTEFTAICGRHEGSSRYPDTGVRAKLVNVVVLSDTATETDEAFSVELTSPSAGYVLGRATGAGVIRNDKPTTGLQLNVGDASVNEGVSGTRAVNPPVSLSTNSATSVTVAVTAGMTIGLTSRYSNAAMITGAMGISLSYVWQP